MAKAADILYLNWLRQGQISQTETFTTDDPTDKTFRQQPDLIEKAISRIESLDHH